VLVAVAAPHRQVGQEVLHLQGGPGEALVVVQVPGLVGDPHEVPGLEESEEGRVGGGGEQLEGQVQEVQVPPQLVTLHPATLL